MAKWYLRRMKLNSGGYNSSGHYYGIGAPLYKATRDDDDEVVLIRARTRRLAIIELKARFPNAKLFVEPRNCLSQTG